MGRLASGVLCGMHVCQMSHFETNLLPTNLAANLYAHVYVVYSSRHSLQIEIFEYSFDAYIDYVHGLHTAWTMSSALLVESTLCAGLLGCVHLPCGRSNAAAQYHVDMHYNTFSLPAGYFPCELTLTFR